MTKNKTAKVINHSGGPMGFVVFTAWVGALIYFVQNSVGVGGFLLAILKSFVWPAFVIHAVLQALHIQN